jgi:rhamnogalacturonan endolyase
LAIACTGLLFFHPARAIAAFGVSNGNNTYIVDTGAGLVFQVSKSSGNINSIVYNGVEYNGPSGKGSEIASGLGTATVTATTYGNDYIKITCQTASNNSVVSSLTQYLMVTNGFNAIYMATYVTAEPAVGELRWISRLSYDLLPNGPPQSDNNLATNAIESTDVFGHADGTVTSKYYARQRAMELTYTGATGNGVGAWMVFDSPRESSASGPFYRDIENQGDGAGSDQEIYNYMNSGHVQLENWRTNVLYGPYAMVFTGGSPPVLPLDYSWIETAGLNLTGWVPAALRGRVTGTVTGIPVGFQGVVGFANPTAQYWAVVSNGSYTTPLMKPGTYTNILYKQELGVATNVVTVTSGATNQLNLTYTPQPASYIFKIGEWDGTPAGFLNASNQLFMHPSDVRNANWGPVTFTVGTSPDSSFPCAQFRLTNSPTTILFNLGANQITNLTLKIGITCAYNNGRPSVTVNGHSPFNPSASPQFSTSRTLTLGTYRGNNFVFNYNIPASSLVVGQNVITITPISGSSDLSTFLSAAWGYDAVELDPPLSGQPSPPMVLSANADNNDQVALAWTPPPGSTNFNLKRSTVQGGPYGTIASGVTNANFLDTGLDSGTTYYYVVSAVNAAGEGPNSGEASATAYAPYLVAWGNNDSGQSSIPPTLTNAVQLAAGAYHTLAVRADGTVFAWGDDTAGQCDVPTGLSNVIAVAAGAYHSLALRQDGSVVAWGDDSAGQIDIPANATNIVAVAAGTLHSLALRADGIVVGWGDDSFNQLDFAPNPTNAIAIAAGEFHSLALRSDCTVVACGYNLGPFSTYAGQATVPGGLNQVIGIAAGGYHSLALRIDGSVVAWGDNSRGQTSIPAGTSNVLAIAAGEAQSLALLQSERTVEWGDSLNGQSTIAASLGSISLIAAGGYECLALRGLEFAAPQLLAPVRHGSSLMVPVATIRGKNYFLLTKNSLSDSGWTLLSGSVGDGSVKNVRDYSAPASRRFYRVRQSQ